jgi:hypothetical protein
METGCPTSENVGTASRRAAGDWTLVRVHARVTSMKSRTTWLEVLFSKINKNGPIPANRPDLGPCWVWTSYVMKGNRHGYGRTRDFLGKNKYVHIIVYEEMIGSVPNGKQLDHLCRNRPCCNPTHVEPVTCRENLARGDSWKFQASKTHCPKGHPYDEKNTYVRKASGTRATGGRGCLICLRAGARSSRQRHYTEE